MTTQKTIRDQQRIDMGLTDTAYTSEGDKTGGEDPAQHCPECKAELDWEGDCEVCKYPNTEGD